MLSLSAMYNCNNNNNNNVRLALNWSTKVIMHVTTPI